MSYPKTGARGGPKWSWGKCLPFRPPQICTGTKLLRNRRISWCSACGKRMRTRQTSSEDRCTKSKTTKQGTVLKVCFFWEGSKRPGATMVFERGLRLSDFLFRPSGSTRLEAQGPEGTLPSPLPASPTFLRPRPPRPPCRGGLLSPVC